MWQHAQQHVQQVPGYGALAGAYNAWYQYHAGPPQQAQTHNYNQYNYPNYNQGILS